MKHLLHQLRRRVVSDLCYWICEHLDGHTDRSTTCTKLAAGDAIAVARALDWKLALAGSELPGQVASALGTFSPKDWREVMSLASSVEQFMESELKHPEWAHLRRVASN
jgi:hypothetical protein